VRETEKQCKEITCVGLHASILDVILTSSFVFLLLIKIFNHYLSILGVTVLVPQYLKTAEAVLVNNINLTLGQLSLLGHISVN